MTHIFFNPLANHGNVGNDVKAFAENADCKIHDLTHLASACETFADFSADDTVIIAGGDGTLNRVANDFFAKNVDPVQIRAKLQYFPSGSGNDFFRDVASDATETPRTIDLKPYLQNLPQVKVNGQTRLFLNGIGFGIDGYCCEVADKLQRKTGDIPNYAKIAVSGVLGKFHPSSGRIVVDGVETKKYKHIWLAPTMNGRFYGGGMMVAPKQDRLSASKKLTAMVWHDSWRLPTLMIFPKIFKGEHVNPKYKKYLDFYEAHEITVIFDKPTALQIDGETVLNVTEYSAKSMVQR